MESYFSDQDIELFTAGFARGGERFVIPEENIGQFFAEIAVLALEKAGKRLSNEGLRYLRDNPKKLVRSLADEYIRLSKRAPAPKKKSKSNLPMSLCNDG